MDKRSQKIKALENNAEFLEKLSVSESTDEVKELFCSFGISLSVKEVKTFLNIYDENEDKLNDSVLKNVTGGIEALPAINIPYIQERAFEEALSKAR